MKRKTVRKNFTLVELMAVMAVLSILILVAFQFFSTAQNTWSITEAKRLAFEDARIALDIISRDIECAYYGDGSAPFWHWKPSGTLASDYSAYQNGHLAFVADTPIPPNSECTSTLCEIKYQLYYATSHSDANEGWIRRSVTGNKLSNGNDNAKWNFLNNLTGSLNVDTTAFTANSNSSEDYQKLIPYAIDLSFTCDTDTNTDTSNQNTYIIPDTTVYSAGTTTDISYRVTTPLIWWFPTVVTVSITVMDRESWQKWIKLCGSGVYHAPLFTGEPAAAKAFRENHQVTFTKMVYLGNRGQEN